jgi:hypothetical protein
VSQLGTCGTFSPCEARTIVGRIAGGGVIKNRNLWNLPISGVRSVDIGDAVVRMAVGQNMRMKADEQKLSAAGNGVGVEIKSSVYLIDGAKNWPTVLTETLCNNPKLADGTRQEMADLITKELKLEKAFSPTR